MTPITAQTRWWLASLLRHLQATLPEVECNIGPLTSPPDVLPLIVVSLEGLSVSSFLGHRISTVENEQGAWVELRCAVDAFAADDPWHQGVQTLWDALTIATAGGTIPLITEEEPEVEVHHGTLLLIQGDGLAIPEPDSVHAQLPVGPWQVRRGTLLLCGQITRLSGGD